MHFIYIYTPHCRWLLMKILLVHSDFIEYEAKKKAIKDAEELSKETERVANCLVVFCSSEEGDNEKIALKTVEEIKDVAGQVSAHRVDTRLSTLLPALRS